MSAHPEILSSTATGDGVDNLRRHFSGVPTAPSRKPGDSIIPTTASGDAIDRLRALFGGAAK